VARLILISIPDNVDAEDFMNAVKANQVIVGQQEEEEGANVWRYKELLGAKVEALFALPTKFCECPDYAGTSTPTKAFRWMVHAKCAKPRKGANQNPRDLLRPDARPGEVPYYIGFRAGIDMFGYQRTPRS
jgi:hypothetical protein